MSERQRETERDRERDREGCTGTVVAKYGESSDKTRRQLRSVYLDSGGGSVSRVTEVLCSIRQQR